VGNRDWIVEHTGASRITAALWYSKRNEVPDVETGSEGTSEPVARHPEKAVTIARVDYLRGRRHRGRHHRHLRSPHELDHRTGGTSRPKAGGGCRPADTSSSTAP
jgi:hypothetical protein